MRKYWTSDYAVNKDREGIVYQFADGSEIEISLMEYLQVNPDKTEQDFMELKALSDDIYYEQALEDTRYGTACPADSSGLTILRRMKTSADWIGNWP